jgi:hypothetical protein
MGSKQAKMAGVHPGVAGLILSIIGLVLCFIFAIGCTCTACAACQIERGVSNLYSGFGFW